MQSTLVNWQLREIGDHHWVLSMTIAGVPYDVVKVQAIDRDAAAKAVATSVEILMRGPVRLD